MVDFVGSPAGTITQATRGAGSASTSSARVFTSAMSALRSKPTTSWPWRRSRSAMFPPIRPRPTIPIFTERNLPAPPGELRRGGLALALALDLDALDLGPDGLEAVDVDGV